MATSTDNIQPINERIESAQHQLKLVLLGESAVGKTSFLHRFVKDDFTDKREPTVGAGFLTKTTRLDDRLIKLNCWDTAGQERFHSLAPMYYRGAQAAIVMYDVTKQSTFEKAKTWIRELQRQAPPHIVIALVGNKIDLCDSIPPTQQHNDDNQVDGENLDFPENEERQDRQVSKEEASLYATESALLYYETSARLNLNVDKVFTEIAQNVPAEYLTPVRQPGGNKGSNSLLTSNTGNKVDLSNGGSGSRQPGAGCAC